MEAAADELMASLDPYLSPAGAYPEQVPIGKGFSADGREILN